MAQQNPNPNNVLDFFKDAPQPWVSRVDAAVDDNPEEASRAIDVARATGADPAVVAENLEPIERNLKQNLSHQIVKDNPVLQDYINKHPIAAPLANDDLAAMSKAGDSYHKAAQAQKGPWWETGPVTPAQFIAGQYQLPAVKQAAAGIARNTITGLVEPLAAFGRMIGSENLVGIVKRAQDSFDKNIPLTDEEKETLPHLVGQGLGTMLPLLLGAAAGGVPGAALQMGLQTGEEEAEKAEKAGADWQTPFTGGFAIGTALGMLPLSYLEKLTGKAAPGITGFVTQRLKEAIGTGAVLTGTSELGAYASSVLERLTYDPYATYSPDAKRMLANMIGGAILGPTFGTVKAFIDAGEPIPNGVHPLKDAIEIEKTMVDNEKLDEALKDAQATAMKGRQPEFLKKYYDLFPKATMGLDGTKVLELYGEKAAEAGPGDGILGDVAPNIAAQLKAAAFGDDIQVPLPDYVAKIDPKVDKELHDFRRVNPDGMTIDESKNLYQAPAPEQEEPEPTVKPVKPGDMVDLYHGTTKAFEGVPGAEFATNKYEKAVFLSDNPEEASGYAEGEGGRVFKTSVDKNSLYHPTQAELEKFMEKGDFVQLALDKSRQMGKEGVHFDLNGEHVYALHRFPEPKASLGGLARSGDPTVDAVRAQMGMDKILPEPATYRYSFLPGKGLLPEGVTLDGPAVMRHVGSVEYPVLKEIRGDDLLKQIDLKELQGGIPKVLTQFFGNRLAKIAGDTPVQIMTMQEIEKMYQAVWPGRKSPEAFYWRGDPAAGEGPRIVMRDDVIRGEYGHDYAVHQLVHEMAHAASVRAIYADPKLAADLKALRAETLSWIQKNDPDLMDNPHIKYAFKDEDGKEFVAQSYSEPDFQDQLARIPISPELAKRLGDPGARTLWDAAKQLIKNALEKLFKTKLPPTALDAMFTMGERFEAAADVRRPDIAPTKEDIEPPGPTRKEIQLFQDHKALGYTKAHWESIKDKLAEQRADDNEFSRKKAMEEATLRQTERWKQNAAEARPEAEQTVYARPAIRADRFLRLGILDGGKVTRQRLDGALMEKRSPGILSILSPEWYNKKGGLDPDQIAGVLGYRSGDAMISDLTLMKQEMDRAGLTHSAFVESRIQAKVSDMMAKKFGSLPEQILEDAKDHVINDGQFDLIREDTLRLAQKLGFQAPLTKDQIKAMARAQLDEQRQGDIKSSRLADNTGRIGRKIETAENNEDAKEVMKLAQDREISFYKTIEARAFEKDVKKFDRVAKTHRQIAPEAFKDPEAMAYDDFIKLLLGDVGKPINSKYADIKNEFAEKGYKTFADFVKKMWDRYDEFIPAADFILEGKHQKPFEDLTIGEARSFMDLVMSLDKLGRERLKVNTEYGWKQIEPAINQAIDNIKRQYDIKERTAAGETAVKTGEVGKTFKYYLVGSRVVERILSRFDFDNPRGPMNQFVVRQVKDGESKWEDIKREYGPKFRELGIPENLHQAVELPFKIPSSGKDFVRSTRKELLTIMLNMGAKENWEKFTNGWEVDPNMLHMWVMNTATRADWEWVKGVWKIFGDMKKDLDRAYRNTTGRPPGTKEFRTFETPFGTVEGGYYPLRHDRIEYGEGSKIINYTVESGPGYFQTSIPNPHAQEVTKSQYPVSMNLDALPHAFDQIAFDIAMREPLHNVKKFLGDKTLRTEIRNRVGVETDEAISSWLHDISHSAEYNTAAAVQGDKVSQFFRQNVIGYLVGLNPSTVMKHGPTAFILSLRFDPKYLLKAYVTLFKSNPATGDSWWSWMDKNAQEIQRRDRMWSETFGGVYKEVNVEGNALWGYGEATIRDTLVKWGSKPVAISDKLSAKAMWLGAYMRALDEGIDVGEAKFEADRAVRFAHGSTAVSNLPGLVRSRGLNSWFTSLYGFFGTVLQNRIEIGFKLNDMYRLGREGELTKAAKIAPLLAADIFAYVIAPTAIEEWVTGLTTEDRRGWGQHAAWATATGLANSFLGFRDLMHTFEYGLDNGGGLISSAVKPFTNAFKYVNHPDKMAQAFSKERAGDLIADLLEIAGPLTGMPKEIANLERYGWNTMIANREHPYTGLFENWNKYGDVGRGLATSKQKKRQVR